MNLQFAIGAQGSLLLLEIKDKPEISALKKAIYEPFGESWQW